ncbi:MAG: FkbM family methyltransferase [bacterium]
MYKYKKFKNILKFIINENIKNKISYSQCGEDLIVDFICNILKINKPYYLDIGTYHPININNTYLFYSRGSCGVCVEPDPTLFVKIKKIRKRDICLNMGVGLGQKEWGNFYVMTSKTLNTFSKKEAQHYQESVDNKIESILRISLLSINQIIEQYCNKIPNFISLDIEGLELKVLQSFNFNKYRPEIFCIETLTYEEDKSEKKIEAIINLMETNNYFVYADTYINTIFVDKIAWSKRK